MNRRVVAVLREQVRSLPPGRVLCISGGGALAQPFLDAGWEVVITSYPSVDWHHLPYQDASFDAVLSDQVLEHLRDPWRCRSEAERVGRPRCLHVHTTCLMNPVHGSPSDFWRFTPDGLRTLFGGFTPIEVDGWGNPLAPLAWLGATLLHRPVPDAPWHPLHLLATWHRPPFLISTWFVGTQPELRAGSGEQRS